MAKYVQDNAASVRGLALMVTRLAPDGTPITGTDCDNYITGGFISFQFTPEYSEGDEIEIKNAAGDICVTYKLPDVLKNVGVQLEICDPDPVLTEMLVGGDLLIDSAGTYCPPAGFVVTDKHVVGYAAEQTGIDATPNGVALRVWAGAVINGKMANNCPFWDYLFPNVRFRLDGDRVVENGNLATVFAGIGTGNLGYGSGPVLDTTGWPAPAPPADAFDWRFPTFTDRVYAYARAQYAPTGIKGCVANTGVLLVRIEAGAPATTVPSNATRPATLIELRLKGPLGNSAPWAAGQFFTLSDGTMVHWDGTTWVSGAAPAVLTSLNAGRPGAPSPSNAPLPNTLADLLAITPMVSANPSSPWAADEYVQLTTDRVTWNGSTWVLYSGPVKASTEPGDVFGAEASITAEDATNAAKLTGLGYIPVDTSVVWDTGEFFSVGAYDFHWNGTDWAAGAAL